MLENELGCTAGSVSVIAERKPSSVRLCYRQEKPKAVDYFLLDTPYAQPQTIINTEIAEKLGRCKPATLVAVNKILDSLLEQQDSLIAETIEHF